MGYGSYDSVQRSHRSVTKGYDTKQRDDIFEQNKKAEIHEGLNPHGISNRECRDSEAHPNATPVQLYLDVTGSMGHIPHELIKSGLPTLMSTLIERGVPDAALMFGAIGDHKCDQGPLQVAQFESGDAELDMWLERTWLEGGGGGNGGESYLLAWYFAANHVKTDAFIKRGQKGFLFTVGDEPVHSTVDSDAVKRLMGNTAITEGRGYSSGDLLAAAQRSNHVFHIHVDHGRSVDPYWKELLGENLILVSDHRDIPKIIAEKILQHAPRTETPKTEPVKTETKVESDKEEEEIL